MAFEGIFYWGTEKNQSLAKFGFKHFWSYSFFNTIPLWAPYTHSCRPHTSTLNQLIQSLQHSHLDWCECCHSLVAEHPWRGGALICPTMLCISQEEEEGAYFNGNAMSSAWLVWGLPSCLVLSVTVESVTEDNSFVSIVSQLSGKTAVCWPVCTSPPLLMSTLLAMDTGRIIIPHECPSWCHLSRC